MIEKLYYPLFDGEKILENVCVTMDDGKILAVETCEKIRCNHDYLLMPGFIDAHAHMGTIKQVETMLENGITCVCDVSASSNLIEQSNELYIHSSCGMAMGIILNPEKYVDEALKRKAKYIKVLLFNPLSIGKSALKKIVNMAHQNNLKVVVHATEIATIKQAVACNVDVLLHVPLKEEFPVSLAKEIAKKNIAVAPTLVMMKAFANNVKGYHLEDFENAKNAVKTLYQQGVSILVGTDANNGSFTPEVTYGSSIFEEMKLLIEVGMSPTEILRAVTSLNAQSFGLPHEKLTVGSNVPMILIHRNSLDTPNVIRRWINGIEK